MREQAGFTYEEHLPRTQAVLGLAGPHATPPGWTVTERGWSVIGANIRPPAARRLAAG